MDLTNLDYKSIKVDGVDMRDYPDFCDSFISEAAWNDGTWLTDDEINKLNEDSALVYQCVEESLY